MFPSAEITHTRAPRSHRKHAHKIYEDALNANNSKLIFSNMPNWLLKLIFLRSNFKTPVLFAVLNYHVDLPAILLKQFKQLNQKNVIAKIFKDIRDHVKELRQFTQTCEIDDKEFPANVSTASVDKALIDVCFKLGVKFDPLSSTGPIDAITNVMFSFLKLRVVTPINILSLSLKDQC